MIKPLLVSFFYKQFASETVMSGGFDINPIKFQNIGGITTLEDTPPMNIASIKGRSVQPAGMNYELMQPLPGHPNVFVKEIRINFEFQYKGKSQAIFIDPPAIMTDYDSNYQDVIVNRVSASSCRLTFVFRPHVSGQQRWDLRIAIKGKLRPETLFEKLKEYGSRFLLVTSMIAVLASTVIWVYEKWSTTAAIAVLLFGLLMTWISCLK